MKSVLNEMRCWTNLRTTKPRRDDAIPPIVNLRPKTRRNVTCPCGSGAKFKRCCISPELNRPPRPWHQVRGVAADSKEALQYAAPVR